MSTAAIPMPKPNLPEAGLKGPLLWSLVLHGALFGGLLVSTIFSHTGDSWGGPGGGGAVSVKLVGASAVPRAGGAAGIPLPVPEVVTPNRTVDLTKGLYKDEPKPPPTPPTDAQQIPEFSKEKQPKYVSRPSKLLEDKTPPPQNAVPYGQGGAPNVPYGQSQAATPGAATGAATGAAAQFTMGAGGATGAGMAFSGGGGGDFGGRFPWYVDAVRNRVSSNWLQSTVDPGIRFAPRAVVSFDILRSGSIANVQVLQSSGNQSVDTSAVRAILSSSPLNALPGEYSGGKVSVEFWFDFKR